MPGRAQLWDMSSSGHPDWRSADLRAAQKLGIGDRRYLPEPVMVPLACLIDSPKSKIENRRLSFLHRKARLRVRAVRAPKLRRVVFLLVCRFSLVPLLSFASPVLCRLSRSIAPRPFARDMRRRARWWGVSWKAV